MLGARGAGQGANTLHRHVWRQDDRLPGAQDHQHFFVGTRILSQGGHASSFDGEEGQNIGIPDSYLLQVCNVTITKDAIFS